MIHYEKSQWKTGLNVEMVSGTSDLFYVEDKKVSNKCCFVAFIIKWLTIYEQWHCDTLVIEMTII